MSSLQVNPSVFSLSTGLFSSLNGAVYFTNNTNAVCALLSDLSKDSIFNQMKVNLCHYL